MHKPLKTYFEKAAKILTSPSCPSKLTKVQELMEKDGIPQEFARKLSRYERRKFGQIPVRTNHYAVFRCLKEGHLTVVQIAARLDGDIKCGGCLGKGAIIGNTKRGTIPINLEELASRDMEIVQQLWPAPEGTFVDENLFKCLETANDIIFRKSYRPPKPETLQKELEQHNINSALAKKLANFEVKPAAQIPFSSNKFALFRCKTAKHITIARIGDKTRKGLGCGVCAVSLPLRGKRVFSTEELTVLGLEIILDLSTELDGSLFVDQSLPKYLPLAHEILSDSLYGSVALRIKALQERDVTERYVKKLANYEIRSLEEVTTGTDNYALFRCISKGHVHLAKIRDTVRGKVGCPVCNSSSDHVIGDDELQSQDAPSPMYQDFESQDGDTFELTREVVPSPSPESGFGEAVAPEEIERTERQVRTSKERGQKRKADELIGDRPLKAKPFAESEPSASTKTSSVRETRRPSKQAVSPSCVFALFGVLTNSRKCRERKRPSYLH